MPRAERYSLRTPSLRRRVAVFRTDVCAGSARVYRSARLTSIYRLVGNCVIVSELIQDDGQSGSDPANRLQSLTVGKLPSREGQAGQVTDNPVSRELRFERRKPCARVADYPAKSSTGNQ
jgi:hypothetical protein